MSPTPYPAGAVWDTAVLVAFARDCDDTIDTCNAQWFFYNAPMSTRDWCLDLGSTLAAPGTDPHDTTTYWPDNTYIDLANVTGETGCWYLGFGEAFAGELYCDGWNVPVACPVQSDWQTHRIYTGCEIDGMGATWEIEALVACPYKLGAGGPLGG